MFDAAVALRCDKVTESNRNKHTQWEHRHAKSDIFHIYSFWKNCNGKSSGHTWMASQPV